MPGCEHLLMLSGGAVGASALMEIPGHIGHREAPLGKVFQAVPEQIIIIGLEVDLRTVPQEAGIQHQLLGMGQPLLPVSGMGPWIAEIDADPVHCILRRQQGMDNADLIGGQAQIIHRRPASA